MVKKYYALSIKLQEVNKFIIIPSMNKNTAKAKVKLIALDLDDTLLNRKKEVSKKNLRIIGKAIKRGIEFVPVTGRPFFGIPKDVFLVLKPHFVVSMNGAVVSDCNGRDLPECKSQVTLSREDIDFVMELSKRTQTPVEFFTENYAYENPQVYKQRLLKFKGTVLENYISATCMEVEDIHEFAKTNNAQEIALIANDDEAREKIIEELKPRNLKVIPYGNYIEVTAIEADKGKGLLKIAKIIGLKNEEIMVIGDSGNDIPMLTVPGFTSVAMGNACEEAKKAAHFVTKDCDKSGVAYAIKKLALSFF